MNLNKSSSHSKTSYADARLAFGGKELQHHAVLNKTKPKPQNNVFCRLQVGVWRQGAADSQSVKSAWSHCMHNCGVEAQIKLHLLTKISYVGARLAFGGKELQNHTVPKVYGAIEPTAVFVPLKEILKDQETFKTVTTEVFGPLQVSLCPLDVCACPLNLPFMYDFAGSSF